METSKSGADIKSTKPNIFLIQVFGNDTLGVTAKLAQALSTYQATILDINQEIVHRHLSLGILVHVTNTKLATLKKVIQQLFDPAILQSHIFELSPAEYEAWVVRQGKPRYIITMLAPQITAEHLALVSKMIAAHGLNIIAMNRLSGRTTLKRQAAQPRSCLEIEVRGRLQKSVGLKHAILKLSQAHGIDLSFQKDDLFRRHRGLIVFDMDSTLIQAEVIDELARQKGIYAQIAAITESAMRGEIDFRQSLQRRLALLKGLSASALKKVADSLPITPGAERLISTLKKMGYHTAILSGGFDFFGKHIQKKLGIDEVYCNKLEIKNARLTGRTLGPLMDAARKEKTLRLLAKKRGLKLEQTVAVGDGANDLPMLSAAGLGVAFHAKPKVRLGAKHSISNLGLDAILYLMGIRDRDIND